MSLSAGSLYLADQLFLHHDDFREAALSHRRFKHKDILPLLEPDNRKPCWEISEVGQSFEGRSIRLLKVGSGETKVLLWTQMHGDEATATMALFDIFNFLEAEGDGYDDLRESFFSKMTLYFVPMLNPDGAERFQRNTAQMIDMNRDALALQTPEARVLKRLVEELKPDYGFNLHDQNPRYTAGRSGNLATISFLATSYDYALSVNRTRLRSMQLIAHLNDVLQRFIPGQVGRFSDDHEPRAFGDNIQKWGTTLVLLESGGYPADIEKQFVRKLNFVSLLSAFAAIISGESQGRTKGDYEAIPKNERSAYDLIIRGVTIQLEGKSYRVDIGIDREECNNSDATGFCYQAKIVEIGDLQTSFGIEELVVDGLVFRPSRMFPKAVECLPDMQGMDLWEIARQGYGYVRISDSLKSAISGDRVGEWPVQLLSDCSIPEQSNPQAGDSATFFLEKEGSLLYSVANGGVFDLRTEEVLII